MTRTTFGYVRVSTKDQCEDRQLLALRAFPVPERHIFTDKLSGKDFDRPQYRRCCEGSGRATCWWCSPSTGWAAITTRSCASGG